MHWLQALDTSLFYFINRSLSNPLFDWLMPILSGGNGVMRIFVPAALLAALIAIFFGNTRARLCALMIVLVVALGDPLIVNTIKHAIARPRPCIALSEAIARVGRTTSGSMPSSTPPIGLRRPPSSSCLTGKSDGSTSPCFRWPPPSPFRGCTMAFIIPVMFWRAPFSAPATPSPCWSGFSRPGIFSGRTGFHNGMNDCRCSSILRKNHRNRTAPRKWNGFTSATC